MMSYEDDPEYLALLRRVLEEPYDDAPRLVLSDWLEEHGDDWAWLIRYGVRIEEAGVTEAEIAELRRKASDLGVYAVHNRIRPRWVDDLIGDRTEIRRGFVWQLKLNWYEFFGNCVTCEGTGEGYCGESAIPIIVARCCPRCKGTGKFTPTTADLFARHPITEVRLDRLAMSGPARCYTFYNHDRLTTNHMDDRSELPGVLMKIRKDNPVIPAGCDTDPQRAARMDTTTYRIVDFLSEEDADRWLSWQCVAHGRELAGLPPLVDTRTGGHK